MKVIFVGLSNKINCSPLDSRTRSGVLIDAIIERLEIECIKTNLVDFAPIDEDGKLRYPNRSEIELGYEHLYQQINLNNPAVIVGLGNIVCSYLEGKIGNLVKIQHPSYISIYKKHLKKEYIDGAVSDIEKMFNKIRQKSCKKYIGRV